jgi:hypothetical protein
VKVFRLHGAAGLEPKRPVSRALPRRGW